jgi:hypothetical protein
VHEHAELALDCAEGPLEVRAQHRVLADHDREYLLDHRVGRVDDVIDQRGHLRALGVGAVPAEVADDVGVGEQLPRVPRGFEVGVGVAVGHDHHVRVVAPLFEGLAVGRVAEARRHLLVAERLDATAGVVDDQQVARPFG